MAKRIADTDINHENWDKEEEPEEAGSFNVAANEILKERVIRTAKRRSVASSGSTPSPFSNFTFAKYNPASTSVTTTTSSSATSGSVFAVPAPSFATMTAPSSANNLNDKNNKSGDKKDNDDDEDAEYNSALTNLNICVMEWINEHVKKTPCCLLTPVFEDYQKHLSDIEKKYKKKEKPSNGTNDLPNTDTQKPAPSGFSFFSQFPVSSSTGFTSNMFLSDRKEPSTDSKTSESKQDDAKDGDEEDAGDPFQPVQEKDAVYSTRCKLYFKGKDNDKEFKDKGVGTLFLKPVPNSEKTQAIFRADNVTGTVLLNVLLSKVLPVQKAGKNNIMLICVPTPQSEPPPITILLKVKTSADADTLYQKLEEYKK